MYSEPLITLGPVGTDAEVFARTLSQSIILRDSFPEAMDYALRHKNLALVPCGYLDRVNDTLLDSWVDLHFRYVKEMKVIDTYCQYTKPMCLAKRRDVEIARNIVIHPATHTYASQINPRVEIRYVKSKPEAVSLTAFGHFDMCIGSVDIVQRYQQLEIIETFYQQMIWVVYQPLV